MADILSSYGSYKVHIEASLYNHGDSSSLVVIRTTIHVTSWGKVFSKKLSRVYPNVSGATAERFMYLSKRSTGTPGHMSGNYRCNMWTHFHIAHNAEEE